MQFYLYSLNILLNLHIVSQIMTYILLTQFERDQFLCFLSTRARNAFPLTFATSPLLHYIARVVSSTRHPPHTSIMPQPLPQLVVHFPLKLAILSRSRSQLSRFWIATSSIQPPHDIVLISTFVHYVSPMCPSRPDMLLGKLGMLSSSRSQLSCF